MEPQRPARSGYVEGRVHQIALVNYIIGRSAQGLAVLLGIVTLVFVLFALLPGDPVQLMLGQRTDPGTVARVRQDLGLDLPLGTRFAVYINDLSPIAVHNIKQQDSPFFLDDRYGPSATLFSVRNIGMVLRWPYLRMSYQYQRPVGDMLLEALPGTGILALLSMIIATFMGIAFGVIGALNRSGWADRSLMVLSIFGMSLPSFVAAILAVWVLAYLLGHITGLPVTGSLIVVDEFDGPRIAWVNLMLPTLTIAVRPLAVIMQLMRNSMLEVLAMDYVRTATAKGLSMYTVVLRHALRNALSPVITAVSGWLASLLAGAVFVEIVFGWKGLGLIMLNALNTYDLPVVMGCIILVSALFVIINLMVDVLYGIFDPRVSVK